MKPLVAAHARALQFALMAALLPFLCLTIQIARADSATWSSSPTDVLWDDSANWVPQTVPNGPDDVATFATSSVTNPLLVSDDDVITVGGIVFSSGASPFTININSAYLFFMGAGVTNNSAISQSMLVYGGADDAGYLYFYGTSTAGSAMTYTMVGGSHANLGYISFVYFNDTSTAGSANFTLQGATSRPWNGALGYLYDSASLGNATLTVDGATATGAHGAQLSLNDTSTAAQGTLIADGGTNGGTAGVIFLKDDSSGGTAQVQALGNGQLDISGHNLPGVTIGSLTGDGLVFLGGNALTVGSNNLNSAFSGVIQDGGASGGAGGSLVQEGRGTLTLSGASTYTGGTTINHGRVFVSNTSGSATGTGAVTVNAGTLAGTGIIAGAVSISSSVSGNLAPGNGKKLGTLTILGPLTLGPPLGIAQLDLRVTLRPTAHPASSQVTAAGVTLDGVFLNVEETVDGAPPLGTVFTLINNTSATPINGILNDLPEGSTIGINNHMYTVSYVGGDGNDLTLTYVGG